jgi:hypothetical protein
MRSSSSQEGDYRRSTIGENMKKILAITLATVLVASILAGCSGGSSDSGTTSGGTASTAGGTASTAGATGS